MAELFATGVVTLVRASLIFVGVAAVVIGSTQIARTLRSFTATNADSVIVRAGITVGLGAAFLYTACAR